MLVAELLGNALLELIQVAPDRLQFPAPRARIDRQQRVQARALELDPMQIEVLAARNESDRGRPRPVSILASLDDPLQHAQVVAEARPQEFPVGSLTEPIDMNDARQARAARL